MPRLQPDVLVGRDDEVGCLRRLVAEVAAGRGRSVWVEGEPGIGKSSVLEVGLADAESLGCEVFWVSAGQAQQRFPLWVLLDCLLVGPRSADSARAEIAALLRGDRSASLPASGDIVAALTGRLLVLVERLCAASAVVLVVDDFQWADEASVSLWNWLHQTVGRSALLLVAASRPVPVRPEVTVLRDSLTSQSAVMIRLGPLTQPEVTKLVEHQVGAVPGPRLRQATLQAGGNPSYVRQLVDALVREEDVHVTAGVAELVGGAGAPLSLAAAIAGRLGFLSDETVRRLRLAALLGTEFTVSDLNMLTGREANLAAVVAEAIAAGVLAESVSGVQWVFRHALIRQALYERVPSALRSALHRQAAKALAAAGAPAERVAEHLLATPSVADTSTVDWLADAASTLSYRAPQIAVELLERGREIAGTEDPRRDMLDTSLATALFLLGRYADVQRLARGLLARTRDGAVAGRMAWTLGYALLRMARCEEALVVVVDALQRRALTGPWTARLRALQAMILFSGGRCAEAEAIARQAAAEGEQARDWLAVGYAIHTLSLVLGRDRPDLGAQLDVIERGLAMLGTQPESADLRLLLLSNRVAALARLGRWADAGRAIADTLALAERTGSPQRLAKLRLQAASSYFFTGRWDDAVAELDAAAHLSVSDVPGQLHRHGIGALIAIHRDDRAALQQHLRAVDDLQITNSEATSGATRDFALYPQMARAVAAERDGQPGQALAWLVALLDTTSGADPGELPADGHMWLPDLVRLALSVADRATADAAAQACAADARLTPGPVRQAAADYCRGLLATDPTVLLAVADTYHTSALALLSAQALENAAVLLGQQGDTKAGRAAYTEAIDIYAGLEAAWDIRRADTRLRPLGIRRGPRGPRRRPSTGWNALTPTELKVAQLVAQGRSNPAIAADLFLSPRTVQGHVSHILAKLGSRSRVDIAREVADWQHAMSPRAEGRFAELNGGLDD